MACTLDAMLLIKKKINRKRWQMKKNFERKEPQEDKAKIKNSGGCRRIRRSFDAVSLTDVSPSLLLTGHCAFAGWNTKWKRIRHGIMSCPSRKYGESIFSKCNRWASREFLRLFFSLEKSIPSVRERIPLKPCGNHFQPVNGDLFYSIFHNESKIFFAGLRPNMIRNKAGLRIVGISLPLTIRGCWWKSHFRELT